MFDPIAFVNGFRDSAPYIHAHRGRIFVLRLGGEAVIGQHFVSLIHDVILLKSLGIRLVVVHGNRPQMETELVRLGAPGQYEHGLRITNATALQVAKRAAGAVRVEIEAALTMGLTNSPASGARTRVVSGNFVTARPMGVRDGVDFGFTGEVRKIDKAAILGHLGNAIVLVSPLGFSASGEVFNLHSEQLATQIAIELDAAKLIVLTEQGGLHDENSNLIRELNLLEAREHLQCRRKTSSQQDMEFIRQLSGAIHACRNGVKRTHLVAQDHDGGLLMELFSRDGVGTMISADAYDKTRNATIDDVGGILALIEPLEADGVLVRRSREKLENEIDRFLVMERDGTVVACAAAYPSADDETVELACLAVHPAYANGGRGDAMLLAVENRARALCAKRLLVLTTRTKQWFTERGFSTLPLDELPVQRRRLYNYQRNSTILTKSLAGTD